MSVDNHIYYIRCHDNTTVMTRRQAIQQIAILGSAAALFPRCNLEEVPQYSKIPLERSSWNIFKYFSEAVLPVDYEVYPAPDPRPNFILSILNECTPAEELAKVLDGFDVFQTSLAEEGWTKLHKLDETTLQEIFSRLENEDVPINTGIFYKKVKSLAQEHFTTSERFLKEEMDYRFIPAKFQSCVDINTKTPA